MSALFIQNSFAGGLDDRLDPTKSPRNAYPLLVNGRIRKDVVTPTAQHVRINGPDGNYQGLYIFGSFLLVFVSGVAYYGDITTDPIILRPIASWVPMSSSVERIFAEQAPATSSLFNRHGSPDTVVKVFNSQLAVFQSALYCFDGVNPPQAVFPDTTAGDLGSFSSWTQTDPIYVPVGVLPAFAGAKLYLVSPDLARVLQSVSGRPSDFMVNIDNNGNAGGDADTVSQTVSYNAITALRALSTGEVLVATLFGTSVLVPDPTRPIFGEPYLEPRFLFPAGAINEISIVDVLSDTAFITQSGIHAFNAVMQAKRESNNYPLGAKIRTLITNPVTNKAIIQDKTCATLYDDYAMFAVNTIYGYGVIVYDTNTETFQALDLSFGRVKQFAVTKINGSERIFFINHSNQLFEAFAGEKRNVTRVVLGDWTPSEAPAQSVCFMIDSVFLNVREPGQAKVSFFTDSKLRYETVVEVDSPTKELHLPISIPFEELGIARVGASFGDHFRAWKCSVMIEWNFAGELACMSIDGKIETGDNVTLEIAKPSQPEYFAFLADSGYSDELNTGGNFDTSGIVVVNVVAGRRYAYYANGDGELVNGDQRLTQGIFTAVGDTIVVKGSGVKHFSLRTAENYISVLDTIYGRQNLSAVLHGGDFAYPSGTEVDVRIAKLPIAGPLFLQTCGNHDVVTSSGKLFFNLTQTRRFYDYQFKFVDFFFFNSELFEPKGVGEFSTQAGLVKAWLAKSTKPFKLLVTHEPIWTADVNHSPGRTDLAYLAKLPGLSGILAGHAHNMERYVVDGFPQFICGTGGHSLRGVVANPVPTPAFVDTTHFGYLYITADALTCRIEFTAVDGTVLDSYAISA